MLVMAAGSIIGSFVGGRPARAGAVIDLAPTARRDLAGFGRQGLAAFALGGVAIWEERRPVCDS